MTNPPPPTAAAEAGHGHDHDHDHASEGPHHGVLVELGKEEYHAEVLHDDKAETATVYLLDGSAKKAVTTDAKSIVVSLLKDGKPAQFPLLPEPDAADPAGSSSRFVLKSKDLIEALDAKETSAQLTVTIGGVPFTGKIPHGGHDHDHGHDHK